MRQRHRLVLLASTSLTFLACDPALQEVAADQLEARSEGKKAPDAPKTPPAKPPADPKTPPAESPPPAPPPRSCTKLDLPFSPCFVGDEKAKAWMLCNDLGLQLSDYQPGPRCADGGIASLAVECCKPSEPVPVPPPPPSPPPTKCESRTRDLCADPDTQWSESRDDCSASGMEIVSLSFVRCGGGGVNATYLCCPTPPVEPSKCDGETIAHLDRCSSRAALQAEAEARCKSLGRHLQGDLQGGETCGKGGLVWAIANCCL